MHSLQVCQSFIIIHATIRDDENEEVSLFRNVRLSDESCRLRNRPQSS